MGVAHRDSSLRCYCGAVHVRLWHSLSLIGIVGYFRVQFKGKERHAQIRYHAEMGEKPVVGYTVKQTAQSLNVNPVTVRRWIRAGLPAFNVGSTARPDYRIE